MGYCFMDVGKLKTQQAMIASTNHNFRRENVLNADPEKMHLNKVLIEMESDTYWDELQKKIAESPVYKKEKVRSNAVLGLEALLTYTGSVDKNLFTQEAWEKKNIEWLKEEFGADNVVSAICHYDETTPHIHAIIIPMRNGRLNARHFTAGPKALSQMQTRYYESMKVFGLERGLKKSGASHTDIKRYYAMVNKALEEKLPQVERDESAKDYRDRANVVVQDICLKHLSDKQKEERKTQIAKSKLSKAREELKAKSEELKAANAEVCKAREEEKRIKAQHAKWEKENEEVIRLANRMDELLGGLKNSTMPDEEKLEFTQTMHTLITEEHARLEAEMSVTNPNSDEDR